MSFKELKKRDKVKTWENKIKRLYSCNDLTEPDIKYLNIQFDLYKLRKTYNTMVAVFCSGIFYNLYYIRDLQYMQKGIIAGCVGYMIYTHLKSRNRTHYEKLITPYFEKYYIK